MKVNFLFPETKKKHAFMWRSIFFAKMPECTTSHECVFFLFLGRGNLLSKSKLRLLFFFLQWCLLVCNYNFGFRVFLEKIQTLFKFSFLLLYKYYVVLGTFSKKNLVNTPPLVLVLCCNWNFSIKISKQHLGNFPLAHKCSHGNIFDKKIYMKVRKIKVLKKKN